MLYVYVYVYIYTYTIILEKEMAAHSNTLAWENPMDRGAWWATVHGVTKSWTWLSDQAHTIKYKYKNAYIINHKTNIY